MIFWYVTCEKIGVTQWLALWSCSAGVLLLNPTKDNIFMEFVCSPRVHVGFLQERFMLYTKILGQVCDHTQNKRYFNY